MDPIKVTITNNAAGEYTWKMEWDVTTDNQYAVNSKVIKSIIALLEEQGEVVHRPTPA